MPWHRPTNLQGMAETGRVYGGRSDAERRADRRGRLVHAGLALFGTVGWSGTSIERLCQLASVATRSFYEEFHSREQLLRAVYDSIIADAAKACIAAVAQAPLELEARTLAGIGTYVRYLTDDPRRAQVVSSEARSAAVLRADRAAALLSFADLIREETRLLPRVRDEQRDRILGLALAGAVSEVLADWVAAAEPRPAIEPMVSELTRLFVAALTPQQG